ncbi:RNA recognition motif. (a.k.a. RRM, RBD, or RNP domain), putative [Leishmania lindenbergi]|uniref:RNA recognition motif (RRM, RBD, or RNP domain) n=1 Tax=Leishmania lindenbergi TaxID=651832 RepID=A0AAW3A501_9TRYP
MTTLQNLFVAKLPRNLTDADLEQIFLEYHPTNAKVMLDATTSRSKGFGFVFFESEDAGREAYEKLNKTHVTLHGHNFTLCIFPSKHDGKVAVEESKALYVRNIPLKLSQLEVEQFLRGFGPLTYCAMREDSVGGSVWVVYAEYDTVESAKSALASLHGNRFYFNTSVAILAKYADSEEAKRERRRRREQQQQLTVKQHLDTAHNSRSHRVGHGGTRGFADHANNALLPPPPPICTDNSVPHTNSTPGTRMEGAGTSQQSRVFASISHHFSPGRVAGAPPPPGMGQPVASPALLTAGLSTMQQPPPTQTVLVQPQQSPTFTSGSFLNVTFNPTNASTLGNNFTHYGVLDQTPSRSYPGTPLNFSFGPEMENSGALPNGCSVGSNAMLDASAHALTTPVHRSSNLSPSGSYRHNPYAPVTPVSSTHSSTGPSSPLVSSIPYPTAPLVNMHFGASHQVQGSPVVPYPPGQGIGLTNNHFSSRGNNTYLAAPASLNDLGQ